MDPIPSPPFSGPPVTPSGPGSLRAGSSGEDPKPADAPFGPALLAQAFDRARRENRAALVVYLAAGDPTLAATVELARAAVEAGADVLELGIPFSDPLADGPVIQAAYSRALDGGTTVEGALGCAEEVVRATGAPVVLMTALNCVLARGTEAFCRRASQAGAAGILVPDLPVEEARELQEAAARHSLGTVFLAAPDSGPQRTALAAAASTGFLYLLRRRGITGAGGKGEELASRVAEVRRLTQVPVAVGFGIATPQDAAEVAQVADGVIVGSALVEAAHRAFIRSEKPEEGLRKAAAAVGDAVAALAGAVREARRRP